MFHCHFNAELCISKVGSIKYLFKYVCKGQDRITVHVRTPQEQNENGSNIREEEVSINEIKDYQDERYLSATEADWRLRGYSIVEHDPKVARLEVHLEGKHVVYFEEGKENNAAEKNKITKLMAWFIVNTKYVNARHIKYIDFPKYFTWNGKHQEWKPRVQYRVDGSTSCEYDFLRPPQCVVGRMYTVSPREGERYYLRTPLLHRKGATSFQDILNVDGTKYKTYREVCCALGLLSDDKEWQRCLEYAFKSSFEPLTAVFATILAFSQPSNPVQLWNSNKLKLMSDILKRYSAVKEARIMLTRDADAIQYALQDIQAYLIVVRPTLGASEFGLPEPSEDLPVLPDAQSMEESKEDRLRQTVILSVQCFNQEQKNVFNSVLQEILPGVSSENPFQPVSEYERSLNCGKGLFRRCIWWDWEKIYDTSLTSST